jgi:hypothetical protein
MGAIDDQSESILQAKAAILWQEALEISSGGAGASYREILAKSAMGCSANKMVLVAARGGSGAVSCLWSITWTAIHFGTRIEQAESRP